MNYPGEMKVGSSFGKSVNRANVILFDALECRLSGKFGSVEFGPWSAVSGAGLNLDKKLHGTKLAAWLPSKVTTGKKQSERGGVIPAGWWIVLPEILSKGQTSRHLGKGHAPTDTSLKLVPFALSSDNPGLSGQCNRGGFYIHGASRDSKKLGAGSDGCILLGLFERKWLAEKVLAGGGAWLYVYINGVKINQMIERQIANHDLA